MGLGRMPELILALGPGQIVRRLSVPPERPVQHDRMRAVPLSDLAAHLSQVAVWQVEILGAAGAHACGFIDVIFIAVHGDPYPRVRLIVDFHSPSIARMVRGQKVPGLRGASWRNERHGNDKRQDYEANNFAHWDPP